MNLMLEKEGEKMDLNLIRSKIDETDDQILTLFLERMELALSVAEYKKKNSLPVLNQGREDEILSRIVKASPKELGGYAHALFSTLFSLSRAYQEELLQDGARINPSNENSMEHGYGLVGKNLSYSYSKIIHEMLGQYVYDLLPMDESELSAFIADRRFKGLNVTIPYKKQVIPLCDYVTPFARDLNSVNTLYFDDGKLCGTNTDYLGFLYMAIQAGIEFQGKTVLILGDGATGNTIKKAVLDQGAKMIFVASRHPRVTQAAMIPAQARIPDQECAQNPNASPNAEKIKYISYDHLTFAGEANIIINTTPVGTYPNNLDRILSLDNYSRCSGVLDVIYNPMRTDLLLQAKKKGIAHSCGLPMLVAQATASAELFTGKSYAAENPHIIRKLQGSLMNMVLIGMPGCGKTTIGQALAKRLGREFVDLDKAVADASGKSIPEIFKQDGEDAFRRLENQMALKYSKEHSLVIATGGGAVLNSENMDALKQNGLIFFLDRPLENLAMEGRPLSCHKDALKKLFDQRLPLYNLHSDYIIDCKDAALENAGKIIDIIEEN